jgi:cystathionine gamma-synthase
LADAVCTSLTKLVSGRGDAIAGSIVTNPHTHGGRWMQRDLLQAQGNDNHSHNDGGLFCQDAHAILRNSDDFVERNAVINQTAEALADWFTDHDDVQTVYYPKYSAPFHYERVKRQSRYGNGTGTGTGTGTDTGGYGGMMSIILDSHMCQRTFYDALDVAKGPSLGTNFTLVCPYTLLAHYHELDFAMSYNVAPNLLRISVGLEPIDELQSKFEAALSKSRLYPKICMDKANVQR